GGNRGPAFGTRVGERRSGRRRTGDAGGDRAPPALALDADRPPRQQRAAEPGQVQGRRPPGVVGLRRDDPDRALLPLPAGGGSGLDQAPRLPGLPRRAVPARPAAGAVPDHAARVRRPPGLPEPDQGPRSGGFFDRLGRAGGGGAGLRGTGGDLRRAALRPRHREPVHRAVGRRRTRRGQRLGNRGRGGDPGPQQRDLDRRPEPPEPGPRDPGGARGPPQGPVRRCRLDRAGSQIRRPPRSGDGGSARGGAAPPDRRDEQRGIPGPDPAERRHRSPRPPIRRARPCRQAGDLGRRGRDDGRRPAAPARQSRRARPPAAARRAGRGRRGPRRAGGDLRLHRQRVGAAVRRRPAQPLATPDGGADGHPARGVRDRRGRRVERLSARLGGGPVVRQRRRAVDRDRRRDAALVAGGDPGRPGHPPPETDLDPGSARPGADAPRRRPRGRAALGDAVAGRGDLDPPLGLDQQGWRLRAGDGGGLRASRAKDAALGTVAVGPAHRARDLGDEPVYGLVAVRAVPRADRAAPVAAGHRLRPVRLPRSGRPDLRPLRRGEDGLRRHPGRGVAQPGGRRPPEHGHAQLGDRVAAVGLLRAVLRTRGRVGLARRAPPVLRPRQRAIHLPPALDQTGRSRLAGRAAVPVRRNRAAPPGAARRVPDRRPAGRRARPPGERRGPDRGRGDHGPGRDRGGAAAARRRGGGQRAPHFQPGPALRRPAAGAPGPTGRRPPPLKPRPPRNSAPGGGAPGAAGDGPRRGLALAGLPGQRLRGAGGPAGGGPIRPVRLPRRALPGLRHRRRPDRQRGAAGVGVGGGI
ncbi:MAG: Pyruvate dehydrogenase E1 component like, partial [uncultured Thermomicrobiales bacterium]